MSRESAPSHPKWQKMVDHRGQIADWTAGVAFVLTIVVGWAVVGFPLSVAGHDRRLLYAGLVVVAGFLVAAMAQRAIMADYAIEAGPFKFKRLADSTGGLAKATDDLIANQEALEVGITTVSEAVGQAKVAFATGFDDLQDSLLTTVANVKDLDERLGRLEEAGRSDSP